MTYQLERVIKKDKKITKNFNIEIICRILSILYQDGSFKTTNLAMRSHLNYCACKKYLNLLECLDWIEFACDEKNMIINITPNGREIFRHLQNVDFCA